MRYNEGVPDMAEQETDSGAPVTTGRRLPPTEASPPSDDVIRVVPDTPQAHYNAKLEDPAWTRYAIVLLPGAREGQRFTLEQLRTVPLYSDELLVGYEFTHPNLPDIGFNINQRGEVVGEYPVENPADRSRFTDAMRDFVRSVDRYVDDNKLRVDEILGAITDGNRRGGRTDR